MPRIERKWIRFRRQRSWGRLTRGRFDRFIGSRIPFPLGRPGETVPYTGLVLQVEETDEWVGIEFTAIERDSEERETDSADAARERIGRLSEENEDDADEV